MSTEVAIETARKLISIYTEKKLPKYTELNKRYPEGFTRERIERNPEGSLFQMIILAAYDRRPYTLAAKGFEPIWGLVDSGPSLPHILRSNDLFDLDSVIALSERDLASRLALQLSQYFRQNPL